MPSIVELAKIHAGLDGQRFALKAGQFSADK
jgi:hypothetical protein